MRLTIRRTQGGIFVRVAGEMAHGDAERLRTQLTERLAEYDGVPRVRLDVGQVSHADSFGLEALYAIYRYAKSHNGTRLELLGVRPELRELMTLAGFENVLDDCAVDG
ncbi:STAS domain-containing protein [Candidatus Poribacteria bacterium]|nr:STAS domain-containing protein [Candidatus Poribacteria bacterium]